MFLLKQFSCEPEIKEIIIRINLLLPGNEIEIGRSKDGNKPKNNNQNQALRIGLLKLCMLRKHKEHARGPEEERKMRRTCLFNEESKCHINHTPDYLCSLNVRSRGGVYAKCHNSGQAGNN